MKEVTAYQSHNGKLFERRSAAMDADLATEFEALSRKLWEDTGKTICLDYVKEFLKQTFFRKDNTKLRNPYRFAHQIRKLQRAYFAVQAQIAGEQAEQPKQEEECPF